MSLAALLALLQAGETIFATVQKARADLTSPDDQAALDARLAQSHAHLQSHLDDVIARANAAAGA